MERTPSFMSFEVTSTEREAIQRFVPKGRDLTSRSVLTLGRPS
jgi:hypothetical protein